MLIVKVPKTSRRNIADICLIFSISNPPRRLRWNMIGNGLSNLRVLLFPHFGMLMKTVSKMALATAAFAVLHSALASRGVKQASDASLVSAVRMQDTDCFSSDNRC
jgi:hypothetical protein